MDVISDERQSGLVLRYWACHSLGEEIEEKEYLKKQWAEEAHFTGRFLERVNEGIFEVLFCRLFLEDNAELYAYLRLIPY